MILYRVRTAAWARTGKGLREAKNEAVSSQCTGNEETHERLLRFIVAARDGM